MKTVLFTMPTFYYEHPQGVPRLISFLKKKGHCVEHRNINYEFYLRILSESYLNKIYSERTCHTKVKDFFAGNNVADFIKDVNNSNNILNNYFCSLSHPEFLKNINVIKRGLQFIDAAFYPTIHRLDTGISMHYSPYNSRDILKASKDKRHNVIIDFYEEYVLPYLKDEAPDIIGISMSHMNQFLPGFTLARMIKESMKSNVVLGGSGLSQLCGFFLKLPHLYKLFDFAVIGAGEETMDALINELSKRGCVDKIPNLMYKVRKKLKISRYIKAFSLSNAELPEYIEPRPRPIIALEASQNCYWAKCSFCDRGLRYGYTQEDRAKYEEKDISVVFKELRAIKKMYNPLYVRLSDAAVSPQRLKLITNFIRESNLGLKIFTYVRAEQNFACIDFCNQLTKGGLIAVGFGLESGSEAINIRYNKGASLNLSEKILKNFKRAGIHNVLFAMVGFPDGGVEEVLHTGEFIEKNKEYIDMLLISPFTLLYNSYIYNHKDEFEIKKILLPKMVDIPRFYNYQYKKGKANSREALVNDVIKKYSSDRDSLIFKVLKRSDQLNAEVR